MSKDTNVKEYTFRPRRFGDMLGGAPIIIAKDNKDGTYQGIYDFDKMTAVQRIVYHQYSFT